MSKSKAIAKTEEALPQTYDYGDDAGAGFEDQQANEIVISRVYIVQAQSKQLNKRSDRYIEDADVGTMYDSVTNEVLPETFDFIPSFRIPCFVEWTPREKGGGGPWGVYDPGDSLVRAAKAKAPRRGGPLPVPGKNDRELVETISVYGVIPELEMPMLFDFTSSKLKPWRAAYTIMNRRARKGTPLFGNVLSISTTLEPSKQSGEDFGNFTIKVGDILAPDDERLLQAKELKELFKANMVTTAQERNDEEEVIEVTAEERPF